MLTAVTEDCQFSTLPECISSNNCENEQVIISHLHALAERGDLLEYLAFFRLFKRPSLKILLEHIIICFNRFELSSIDFTDVEARLRELARDPATDEGELEQVMIVYFGELKRKIDGPHQIQSKMEAFFDSFHQQSNDSQAVIKVLQTVGIIFLPVVFAFITR